MSGCSHGRPVFKKKGEVNEKSESYLYHGDRFYRLGGNCDLSDEPDCRGTK